MPAQAAEEVEHAAQVGRGFLHVAKQRGRLAHLGHDGVDTTGNDGIDTPDPETDNDDDTDDDDDSD